MMVTKFSIISKNELYGINYTIEQFCKIEVIKERKIKMAKSTFINLACIILML